MPKSKAHKYWNKFAGWASHEGQIRAEMPEALDEFFVSPSRIPEDSRHQVQQLFEGWFFLERRIVRANLTPIELFLKAPECKSKAGERDIYRRFADENRFGFFKVEDTVPGESMELRLMPDGDLFHVAEVEGSKSAEKGSYLITRLIPFEDHWVLCGLVGAFPSDASYMFDRSFGETGRKLKPGELRPRHVLSLFMPKVDWEREGLPRVKARLAMILQRWGVVDVTASMVDEDILAAHERRELTHPLLKTILGHAPSADDAAEAVAVLAAWWNLTLPERPSPRGPKETMLLADLQRVVGDKVLAELPDDPKKAEELARAMTRTWLNTPQKELDGKTPVEVMGEERKALGDPREELGVSILPTKLEIGTQEMEGVMFANQARAHLLKKDAARALECLQKAYASMKGHHAAFRVLGNMATAYVMLGRREDALETLRAALKANPDYDLARDNLHLLEGMTPDEFAAKHRDGFFEQMNVVTEE
ncbi:MAG: tetratricopeptide repeat protein [Elusimicrobiota bacterium]